MKSNQKIAALAGVATALLIGCFMGAYALTNYATPFQIQPVNATNNTQTVAIGSGCTLGADAGSTVDLSAATVVLPASVTGGTGSLSIGAGNVTTTMLHSAAVTGAKLSGGTAASVTSGSITGGTAAGACTLTGATVGQRVFAVFDISGSGSTGAENSFEAAISGSGVLQQTSTANLSSKKYGVILLPPGS